MATTTEDDDDDGGDGDDNCDGEQGRRQEGGGGCGGYEKGRETMMERWTNGGKREMRTYAKRPPENCTDSRLGEREGSGDESSEPA